MHICINFIVLKYFKGKKEEYEIMCILQSLTYSPPDPLSKKFDDHP